MFDCLAFPIVSRTKRSPLVAVLAFAGSLFLSGIHSLGAASLAPLPDRVVVLTFDDSVRSHYTVVRPLLKELGFNATFFITEGFDFKTNDYRVLALRELDRYLDPDRVPADPEAVIRERVRMPGGTE
jgi:peptidoglycan/xylan/chitin deacetylase (PgdA/CDA1 family)